MWSNCKNNVDFFLDETKVKQQQWITHGAVNQERMCNLIEEPQYPKQSKETRRWRNHAKLALNLHCHDSNAEEA